MRPILTLLLLSLALAPSAAALLAPPAGALRQGETRTHHYDGSEGGLFFCPAILVTYVVTVDYAPATDVLTLVVEGRGSAVGSDGRATLSFTSGACGRFTISVEGTSVERAAAYIVSVEERTDV